MKEPWKLFKAFMKLVAFFLGRHQPATVRDDTNNTAINSTFQTHFARMESMLEASIFWNSAHAKLRCR
ncbi:MAG: hypothetical protein CMO55_17200 [Verrucomicrobiales bacterium]|nr:hypothetical protein [Verrucomicrobiales bacterium]